MSLYTEIAYARQLAFRLQGYKEKSSVPYVANFRCPICNDSAKKLNKKRGYFYTLKGHILLRCHNCNASMSFGQFLKGFDYNLYEKFTLDNFKAGAIKQNTRSPEDVYDLFKSISPPETKKYVPNIICSLKSIDELSKTHHARKYIENRLVPEDLWHELFYAPKFYEWASGNCDKFAEHSKADHPRLIIPWTSSDGVVFAYTARSFGNETPKYYKVIVDDSYPAIFGLNKTTNPNYILEGPLDALFLPGAVAVGTSSLHIVNYKDATYIPDKDVRNKEIMREVRTLIKQGRKVCMLPEDFPKDINEAVMKGFSVEEIVDIIEQNTYNGLMAELHYMKWSKIK